MNYQYLIQWQSITLQELKLQGIKIRDGVVFSRYSQVLCFAIHTSGFGQLNQWLCSTFGRASVIGRAQVWIPLFEQHLTKMLDLLTVLFSGILHLLEEIFSGFKSCAILAVANFTNINSDEYFYFVG